MLKCAFYEKEITPPLECQLAGYFNARPSTGVKDRLYVKAAVFENDGETVAFIAADACGLAEDLCNKIISRVERICGIKSENIMVISTHSHTSLPVGMSSIIHRDDIYLDVFCRLAADCAILAYQRLVPVTLKYAKGDVDNISFVRDYLMKDGSIKTNPGRDNPDVVKACDEIDPDFPILVAYDEEGRALGSISNFACHLDCIAGYEYSGDFASVISYEFKKKFDNDFVSLFMMGTSGNINHCDVFAKEPRKPDHYVWMGKTLANEAFRVLENAVEINNPSVSSKKEVIVAKRRWPTDEELKEAEELAAKKELIDAQSTDRSLAVCYKGYLGERLVHYAKDKRRTRNLILQLIKIGHVSFFSFPGEVSVNYGRDIKNGSDTEKVFISTITNNTVGYFPAVNLFDEKNLYEVKISAAPFEPEMGNIMVNKLLEMQK